MANAMRIGIIGCGNISTTYFSLPEMFRGLKIVAGADIDMKAARARAAEYGVKAMSVDEMLHSDDVDIIVNLTIPAAHYEVSAKALDAGKHVYSEKPFVLTLKEGRDLEKRAAKKKLRIGSAPDTFMGGAHQLARHIIDSGAVGKITGGTATVMSHGMEHWHPNPDFFFKPGGGPILDLGPYYITNLVQLIGPVKRVAAISSIPSPTRTITSQPRHGQKIKVETPTTFQSLLYFENGAVVTFGASWDVWKHSHTPMELYGEKGTVYVPDPNFFGGAVAMSEGEKMVKKLPKWKHAFSITNQSHPMIGPLANYRTAGLADMAQAILEGRPHRCSFELALHVVDVMTSIIKSGETGKFIDLATTCERPAAVGVAEAKALMAKKVVSVVKKGRGKGKGKKKKKG
jgi:predicted dehydrogenase